MGLNKQTGNMYPFVTHTWNPVRGKCPHDCLYCYMKVYPQPELRFVEKEMDTQLGQGNFIFVGSSTDMWAGSVSSDWLKKVLYHCGQFDNQYLFQSKNPARFALWRMDLFPFPEDRTVLGTTIESNREYDFSLAPPVEDRLRIMRALVFPKMVSIEPILDFDPEILIGWIKQIKPDFVSIGADSKGHNLPEPNAEKTKILIEELQGFTKVYVKDNLNRLLK